MFYMGTHLLTKFHFVLRPDGCVFRILLVFALVAKLCIEPSASLHSPPYSSATLLRAKGAKGNSPAQRAGVTQNASQL
jgi:hypothetical protein